MPGLPSSRRDGSEGSMNDNDNEEFCNRAEMREALDDLPQNPSIKETIGDIINARFHRREVMRGMLGVAAVSAILGAPALLTGCSDAAAGDTFHFDEIAGGVDEHHHVADGYDAQIL